MSPQHRETRKQQQLREARKTFAREASSAPPKNMGRKKKRMRENFNHDDGATVCPGEPIRLSSTSSECKFFRKTTSSSSSTSSVHHCAICHQVRGGRLEKVPCPLSFFSCRTRFSRHPLRILVWPDMAQYCVALALNDSLLLLLR